MYGCPVSTFYLQGRLSDTDLCNYVRSSEVPNSSSTWVLAGSLLAAGDALPGLGITQSSELISCPAHVGLPGGELEAFGPCPAVQGDVSGKLLLFLLGKDAVFYEADDCLGNLCHYQRRD